MNITVKKGVAVASRRGGDFSKPAAKTRKAMKPLKTKATANRQTTAKQPPLAVTATTASRLYTGGGGGGGGDCHCDICEQHRLDQALEKLFAQTKELNDENES